MIHHPPWTNEVQLLVTPGTSRRKFTLGIKEEFTLKQLNLITGPSGNWRTSFIMALLGQLLELLGKMAGTDCIARGIALHPSGADSGFNLPRAQGVAYASQNLWFRMKRSK